MKLRICDGERERIAPASIELVEEAFAPETRLPGGAEIALADGERWIAAIAVSGPVGGKGDGEEFLLSGASGEADLPSGRVHRAEALRRFREFIRAGVRADGQSA